MLLKVRNPKRKSIGKLGIPTSQEILGSWEAGNPSFSRLFRSGSWDSQLPKRFLGNWEVGISNLDASVHCFG